jgi:hypothetical protein
VCQIVVRGTEHPEQGNLRAFEEENGDLEFQIILWKMIFFSAAESLSQRFL